MLDFFIKVPLKGTRYVGVCTVDIFSSVITGTLQKI